MNENCKHFLLILGICVLGLQARPRRTRDSGADEDFLSDNLLEGSPPHSPSIIGHMEAIEGDGLQERSAEEEMPRRFRIYPVQLKEIHHCSPPLINMFIEDLNPKGYAPYNWNSNIPRVCPNLEQTCCESHLLVEKQKELQSNYALLTAYRTVEQAIQRVKVSEQISDEEYDEALMVSGIEILRQDLPTNKAVDIFLLYFKQSKTNLLTLINSLAKYYSGFLCQFCHVDSLQYFSFDVDKPDAPKTLLIQEEDLIYYLKIAHEYLEIEKTYALAYSLIRRSKEFRDQFPQPIDFDPEEDYEYLTRTLNTCIDLHKVRFEVYRRASCLYLIERLGFQTRVQGLEWIKTFLTQVVSFLGDRVSNNQKVLQTAQELPTDLQFWKPKQNVVLDFNQFVSRHNISLGLSMTARPMELSMLSTGSAGGVLAAVVGFLVSLWLN